MRLMDTRITARTARLMARMWGAGRRFHSRLQRLNETIQGTMVTAARMRTRQDESPRMTSVTKRAVVATKIPVMTVRKGNGRLNNLAIASPKPA